MILTCSAANVPSRLAPSFTYAIWSRPWCEAIMFSERVSIHFTGRPSLREHQASRISSP